MNSTGLSIIKTLGCMTAVTFFTIYNTWDRFEVVNKNWPPR